jgi:hypothetical protein
MKGTWIANSRPRPENDFFFKNENEDEDEKENIIFNMKKKRFKKVFLSKSQEQKNLRHGLR